MPPAHIDFTSVDSPTSSSTVTIRLEDLRRLDPSRIPHAEFVDDRLAQLEGSIDAIRDVVVHLRGLHNANAKVSRIPPELLTSIFSYLQDQDADLVRITLVCHEWRKVALDSSHIWTRVIVTSSVEKGEAYIQRSRRRLVDVYFKPSSDQVVWKFPRMLRLVADRLRAVVVEASDASTIGYLMAQMWSLSAPHLETLHLLGKVVTDFDRIVVEKLERGREMFIVPTNWEENLPHTPALRSLRLHPIGLSWHSTLYSGLSVLELRVPGMIQPTLGRVLEILRQCPGLESLHLDLSALVDPIVPEDDSTDVSLPLLSTCTLVSLPPTSIADLLSHLILPPATRYRIVTRAIDRSMDLEPPDYAVLPEDCNRLTGLATIRMIEFSADIANGLVHIHCYHPSIGGLGDPILAHSVFVQNEVDEVFTALGSTFHLGEVDTPVVTGVRINTHAMVDEMWSSIFDGMQELRTLRLIGLDSHTIASAFDHLQSEHWAGIPCSELEEIELVDVSLHERWLVRDLVDCAVHSAGTANMLHTIRSVDERN
ncbi:hypothetical protein C8T65DRAFT_747821 [Cerioporus squamosus]|nr:hypothetical protein C8T65DRAFT_747821 [Cerioporus squamosus]